MTDFTAPQILTLRRQYLRDLVDTNASPALYLSHYNRATKTQFISDADINAIKARVENDRAEELSALWTEKHNTRLWWKGDSEAAASAAADDLKLQATYRLVTAEVLELFRTDPGVTVNIPDEKQRTAFLEGLNTQITAHRLWVMSRTGPYASVPIVRQ
jgi:hypothetical protein